MLISVRSSGPSGPPPMPLAIPEADAYFYFAQISRVEIGQTESGFPALQMQMVIKHVILSNGAWGPTPEVGRMTPATMRLPLTPSQIQSLTGRERLLEECVRDHFNRFLRSILDTVGAPMFTAEQVEDPHGFEFDTDVLESEGYMILSGETLERLSTNS